MLLALLTFGDRPHRKKKRGIHRQNPCRVQMESSCFFLEVDRNHAPALCIYIHHADLIWHALSPVYDITLHLFSPGSLESWLSIHSSRLSRHTHSVYTPPYFVHGNNLGIRRGSNLLSTNLGLGIRYLHISIPSSRFTILISVSDQSEYLESGTGEKRKASSNN